jgi:ubiquinone/menaquinone biosynthesis C-methylase UbiE
LTVFSVANVEAIRAAEIERIASWFSTGQHILEIGAGTGKQARELSRRGFQVTAIEIPQSNYAAHRHYPIVDYDGRHIPLPDQSVDVVFSSNVLEHVVDLPQIHSEIRRVLRPGGYCIHVMPTTAWRAWTILSSYPDAAVCFFTALPSLLPRGVHSAELRRLGQAWYRTARYVGGRLFQKRHGERGTTMSELWLFRAEWWRRNFRENGFAVVHDEPMRLFYTGNSLLGPKLDMASRERLGPVLGSACHLYKVRPELPR